MGKDENEVCEKECGLDEFMDRLNRRQCKLERQLWCGVKGHVFSISRDERWNDRMPPHVYFACIRCEIDYCRNISDLTPKEKVLLAAFDMKD